MEIKQEEGGVTFITNSDEIGNYYGWARIEKGKVIQVGEERSRDGGAIWHAGTNQNGYKSGTDAYKRGLADWPKLVKAISDFLKT